MFNTGLDCYKDATVENFTTNIGIRLRRVCLNKPWRKILQLCTKRKIILEQYPTLVKDEEYVFCCNHSFDEDVISALASIDRQKCIYASGNHRANVA